LIAVNACLFLFRFSCDGSEMGRISMSMVEDIGGKEGLRQASAAIFEHSRENPVLRGFFAPIDTPEQRARFEEALKRHLDFDSEAVPEAMAEAHRPLMGQGLTDADFDAIYDLYHETLSEVGVPGGMLYGFLEAFEDLRDRLVED
jgi:truncated hemoglobin YjbI